MRTEIVCLPATHQIGAWCHLAKNLYNAANYIQRQSFFETGKILSYQKLEKMMKNKRGTKYDDFGKLPSHSAQLTLIGLCKSWTGFFASLKAYKIDPTNFTGRPRPPGYYDKDGEAVLFFANKCQCFLRDSVLRFPKVVDLGVKTRLPDTTDLREVRIVPRGGGYKVEIIYEEDANKTEKRLENKRLGIKHPKKTKPEPIISANRNRILGIDPGMCNIITMVNNIGEQPIAVKDDGTGIKSINQFYAKRKAELQKVYSKAKIMHSRRLDRLDWKHAKKVTDYLHKLSRFIIDWCVEHTIGRIIVGRNKGWKQFIDKGKQTNQTFVSIPYFILINQIKYKGAENGIEVDDPEESYTSKCSFLDCETIEHHDTYLGRRTKRGMFVSGRGIKINADCNGGYNIVRKSDPEAFSKVDGVGGCGLHPRIIYLKGSC